MKKKIGMFCLFVTTMLLIIPVISALDLPKERLMFTGAVDNEKQDLVLRANPKPEIVIGYLLIHVFAFTPGMGVYSYKGAVVNVKGFLYSYNGTTDDNGEILFSVHSNLFRPKIYFVKISIFSNDRLVSKINSVLIHWQQVVYKDFLFVIL